MPGDNGVEAHIAVIQAFTAMKLPENKDDLPAWTAELSYVNGELFAGKIDCPGLRPHRVPLFSGCLPPQLARDQPGYLRLNDPVRR